MKTDARTRTFAIRSIIVGAILSLVGCRDAAEKKREPVPVESSEVSAVVSPIAPACQGQRWSGVPSSIASSTSYTGYALVNGLTFLSHGHGNSDADLERLCSDTLEYFSRVKDGPSALAKVVQKGTRFILVSASASIKTLPGVSYGVDDRAAGLTFNVYGSTLNPTVSIKGAAKVTYFHELSHLHSFIGSDVARSLPAWSDCPAKLYGCSEAQEYWATRSAWFLMGSNSYEKTDPAFKAVIEAQFHAPSAMPQGQGSSVLNAQTAEVRAPGAQAPVQGVQQAQAPGVQAQGVQAQAQGMQGAQEQGAPAQGVQAQGAQDAQTQVQTSPAQAIQALPAQMQTVQVQATQVQGAGTQGIQVQTVTAPTMDASVTQPEGQNSIPASASQMQPASAFAVSGAMISVGNCSSGLASATFSLAKVTPGYHRFQVIVESTAPTSFWALTDTWRMFSINSAATKTAIDIGALTSTAKTNVIIKMQCSELAKLKIHELVIGN